MANCGSCNDGNRCNNRCNNPCGVTEGNTAECESLPSQIENFTLQFFGTVVKTEVDGQVLWSLPCSLDVGLPANPRGVDEGLACYFLRLFNDGIVGLKGDKGTTGATGTDGRNAYTVTLQSFSQPTLALPNIQVVTQYNPAIMDGTYVFIDTSGWYLVTGTDGNGILYLTLAKDVASPPVTVTAGKLVVLSGFPGQSIQGPQGVQGVQGPTGSSGSAFTTTNGTFVPSGNKFPVPLDYDTVAFPSGNTAEFLFAAAGTYLVNVTVQYTPTTGVALGHNNIFAINLRNTSTSTDVPASELIINNMTDDYTRNLTVSVLVTTTGPNETVALQAHAYSTLVVEINPGHTFMNYVRVA